MGSIGTAKADPSRLEPHLATFRSILPNNDAIITPDSSAYQANADIWSTNKDRHPALALRPNNINELSKLIKYLSSTDLDWKVRSKGFGNATAYDVVVSLAAFDDFEFNKDRAGEEYVILGAGQDWQSYYERMEEVAPDWTIVSVRTPCVGVGGSTLCTGFSWLSSQYGALSDPANMLDARVVLADGTVKWASEDPELLWAIRGTETGFAIVTHFKFRARKFERNGTLWAGPILIPRTQVQAVAKGIMGMVEREARGELGDKTAMFLYVMRKEMLAFIGATDDVLVVHCFCQEGEEKGRKEFAWALNCEGAIDQTKGGMTLWEVSKLQEHIGGMKGISQCLWSPMALTPDQMSEQTVVNAFEWWNSILKEPSSVAENGWLLFELFSCRDNLTGRESSPWPRPKNFKHMVLCGVGCAPEAPKKDLDRAQEIVMSSTQKIVGRPLDDMDIIPNALEEFHNLERVFGPSYPKLRAIKRRVDPQDKLKGWFRP